MGNSNSPENGLLDNPLLQVPLKHLRADYYKMNGREVLMTVQCSAGMTKARWEKKPFHLPWYFHCGIGFMGQQALRGQKACGCLLVMSLFHLISSWRNQSKELSWGWQLSSCLVQSAYRPHEAKGSYEHSLTWNHVSTSCHSLHVSWVWTSRAFGATWQESDFGPELGIGKG